MLCSLRRCISGNSIISHVRLLSTSPQEELKTKYKMKAWQIHSYGNVDELQLGNTRIPYIKAPTDVLVKINAASLNPIDLAMIHGYARTIIGMLRKFELEFPLTVGRDFCGTVVDKGRGCDGNLQVGDQVYGFIPLQRQGSLAEYAITDWSYIAAKPVELNDVEAASLPYSAMTAWSALYITGNLCFKGAENVKVLVLGASGGVGTIAVQMLKSQGATVVATCSDSAKPFVESLGADHVLDYNDACFSSEVRQIGRYNMILDCANVGYKNIPPDWDYSTFITLNSPLMNNTDRYGLLGGFAASFCDLVASNASVIGNGRMVKWGYFVPSQKGFQFVDRIVKSGKIRPKLHKVFNFEEVPDAFKTLADGHMRGKIVINF